MIISLPAMSHQWSVLGGQSVEPENELLTGCPNCSDLHCKILLADDFLSLLYVLIHAALVAAHEC